MRSTRAIIISKLLVVTGAASAIVDVGVVGEVSIVVTSILPPSRGLLSRLETKVNYLDFMFTFTQLFQQTHVADKRHNAYASFFYRSNLTNTFRAFQLF